MEISLAKKKDLNGINDIYNYYISNTAYTFDINQKTIAEKQEWFHQFKNSETSICLVGYENDELVGFVVGGVDGVSDSGMGGMGGMGGGNNNRSSKKQKSNKKKKGFADL